MTLAHPSTPPGVLGHAHRCGAPMPYGDAAAWNGHAVTCRTFPALSPLDYYCPACSAAPGEPCRTGHGERRGAWSCRRRESLAGVDTRPMSRSGRSFRRGVSR
jgi:hypothetical protein